jgi:thiol-disulfide isomerase/thioredoxin
MSTRRVNCVAAGALTAVLGVTFAGRAGDDSQPLAGLQREHERAYERLLERWERAKTDAERSAVQAERWKEFKVTARRAFAFAEAHPADPAAIDAIVWAIHGLVNGCYAEYRAEQAHAYNLLAEKALSSKKVVPVCYYAGGSGLMCPEARRFLETALEKSPIKLVRGTACLGLAIDDQETAELVQRSRDPIVGKLFKERLEEWKGTGVIEQVGRLDPEVLDREAEARFERVVAEFGDLKMPYPYNETTFAELARGALYEIRHLGIGKPAPDLDGEDVRGGKLRLGDFRGKVVAVVFWATWCGPCMAMVPHERDLVKRMKGKPFALFGVNGDDDRSRAKEVVAKESMSWPSLWNGGKLGGVVTRLGVRAWPTVYVLDAQGVIRYKNVRQQTLDQTVDRLVGEAEAVRK